MLQIALVADQHDDNVRVGMIAQLLQPPRNVDIRCVFGDIIYQKRSDCAAVVPGTRLDSEQEMVGTGHTHAEVIAR
jgi:predicted phosphodiesterase